MTRHLCAAVAELPAPRSTAAGVAADRTVARMAPTAMTARATRWVVRSGSRIGSSCLSRPVPERLPTVSESASGSVTTFFHRESSPLARKLREIPIRLFPERSGTCFNGPMGQMASNRLTIRQIADLAGVSIATVSRVMNGRNDVAPDTREAVTRGIRENGYTANRSARGLSAGRTGLVGVLVPLIYPAYFSSILAGAAEALAESDLQIVLSPTGHQHDREVSVLDRLHGLSDGALIILPEESNEELERMLDGGFRFVVIDPLMPLDERIP